MHLVQARAACCSTQRDLHFQTCSKGSLVKASTQLQESLTIQANGRWQQIKLLRAEWAHPRALPDLYSTVLYITNLAPVSFLSHSVWTEMRVTLFHWHQALFAINGGCWAVQCAFCQHTCG